MIPHFCADACTLGVTIAEVTDEDVFTVGMQMWYVSGACGDTGAASGAFVSVDFDSAGRLVDSESLEGT